jgi:hypothetical protein
MRIALLNAQGSSGTSEPASVSTAFGVQGVQWLLLETGIHAGNYNQVPPRSEWERSLSVSVS